MTKEEIQEGLLEIAHRNYVLRPEGWTYQDCMVRDMLVYLDNHGLVLKVERELPKDATSIFRLWDGYTDDMNRIYQLLMDGKSELASIILQERKTLHNGQSRECLWDFLRTYHTAVEPLI